MKRFIGLVILSVICLHGAVSSASPADTPTATSSDTPSTGSADTTVAVILLNNGASITGLITVDEPDRPVVIIRQSDKMEFEVPRKDIYRITDPEHFDQVRAEYDSIPVKKPLLYDPEIWTFAGMVWGESLVHFCGDGLGLYRAGDSYRVGLGVGYSFEEDGILILVTHGQRDFGGAAVRCNLFGEAGYVCDSMRTSTWAEATVV